jgi:mannose-6-phosphate isomerase-like protein (cupin superfamily)
MQMKEGFVRRVGFLIIGLASLAVVALVAQTTVVVGDRSTPLRPVAAAGNVGISNAVLRDQGDVRALRVVVEPGGTRVMHAHDDVKFHLFVPISGQMTLNLEGAPSVVVPPWQPYYMKVGTRHGFQNTGTSPVEIMEVFVK